MKDTFWMQRALGLAPKGFPEALPNPLVGCIIVKNGRLVSEGFHRSFGGPHAEIEALKRAGNRARGAEMFVTLTPCSHWGKTPPCTNAIIEAGIRRVVIAVSDPHKAAAGKSMAQLKRAGIKVQSGLEEGPASALNLPFFTGHLKNRPYIILKAAVTLDGKITDAQGRSQWITSEKTRRFSRGLRSCFDAIAVGVQTVLKDNPRLTSTNGRNPLRVILDPSLRTPLSSYVTFTGIAGTLIAAAPRPPLDKFKKLANKNIEVMSIKKDTGGFLDLKRLCRLLDLKGAQTLLVEGGAATHARFMEAGLVDEMLWFVAPKAVGGLKALSAIGGEGLPLSKALHFTAMKTSMVGDTALIRATRHPKGLFWPIPGL